MPIATPAKTEAELHAIYAAAQAACRIADRRAEEARRAAFYARQHLATSRAAYYSHPAVKAREEAQTIRDLSNPNITI